MLHHVEYLVQPATTWSVAQAALFTGLTLTLTEGLGWSVFTVFGQCEQLKSRKGVDPDWSDTAFINFNKLFTVIFFHLYIRYAWESAAVCWATPSFSNTVVAFALEL